MNLENPAVETQDSTPPVERSLSSVIASLDETPAQQETPPDEKPAEPEVTETPPAVETPEETIQRLERIIAMDPVRRQIYQAERFGIPPQGPPPQAPPQQQQPPAQKVLSVDELKTFDYSGLFKEDEFDLTDPNHVGRIVAQALEPFADFIKRQDQENQQVAQQQETQQVAAMTDDLNKKAAVELEKIVPGLTPLFEKQYSALSLMEQVFVDSSQRLIQQKVESLFPPQRDGSHIPAWCSPDVHKEAIRLLAPQLKELASTVQKDAKKAPANGKPPANAAPYVEPGGAVPVGGAVNPFKNAYAAGDVRGMIEALASSGK